MISIPKNAREEYRIERQDFRGHDLLNIRVFYDDGTGEMRPGKQGIAIRMDLVPELMDAIDSVVSAREAA